MGNLDRRLTLLERNTQAHRNALSEYSDEEIIAVANLYEKEARGEEIGDSEEEKAVLALRAEFSALTSKQPSKYRHLSDEQLDAKLHELRSARISR